MLGSFQSPPFWVRSGQPALLLAPMEGVIDAPMRTFLTEFHGIDFSVSEFLRISQDIPPARVFFTHTPELKKGGVTPTGVPVQLQLLGGDPEKLAAAAVKACETGAWGIDLNFGCPAPTVNRHDGGASLLRFPERIRAIVEAVRQAVPSELPVSAKLRLGWDTIDSIHPNVDRAVEGGASWITIHARTKVQGYALPVHWSSIGEVRKRLAFAGPGNRALPVIANGEIWSVEDFLRCQDETGCEHFMLGRGVLGNVHLPLAIARELKRSGVEGARTSGEAVVPDLESPAYWLPLFKRYSEVCAQLGMGSGYALRRMKQWAGMVKGKRRLEWFDSFKRASALEEAFRILSQRGSQRDG